MSLKEEICSFITCYVAEHNAEGRFREPLVGFSAAADPLYPQLKEIIGEHHMQPEDLLPGARTVISFFIPFSRPTVEANRRQSETAREWAEGYIYLNRLINALSQALIAFLEERGHQADYVRPTHTFDPVTLKAPWSHRSAAYIAGLGSFGLNRMLITEKGCAGRFGTVATSVEITADTRPEVERCLHYSKGSCDHCVKHCPTQTLPEFDRHVCYEQLLAVDALYADLEVCDVCGKCVTGPCAFLA